jgi:WD40 repeat protein
MIGQRTQIISPKVVVRAMAEVFISYASADAPSAGHVADRVRQAGHRVFRDSDHQDGITPGAGWQKTLFRELRLCDAVVFLNSGASQASMWCHSELVIATELGKRIYSLDLAPGLTPHPLLRSLQGIKLESTLDASIQRLIDNLDLDGLAQGTRFKWERGRSPYPGLAAMDVADAGVFFGRDDDVRNLVNRVDGPLGQPEGNLVVVMGPSGAGKSSLVRAGLVARLEVPRSGWAVPAPFVPDAQPLTLLASHLAALVPGRLTEDECRSRLRRDGVAEFGGWLLDRVTVPAKRLLITVDQAEQLATGVLTEERDEFLDVLATGLGARSPVTVVMTVRSDRFDEIQRLPAVGPTIRTPFVIAPMSRLQLAAVIEGPAERADLTIARGLAGRLIDDAVRGNSGEAGDALPFLAFTLREMYDLAMAEDRDMLTGDDYQRVGLIEGAIVRRTTAAEASLPPDSDPVLDGLLPRFVTLSEDRLPAGRPVLRDRLSADEREVVDRLEDQRLLIGAGGTVRLAHEQLITAWPRLAEAVADRREDLVLQARLERQASDWERGHGELLGRGATEPAAGWLAERAEPGTGKGPVGDYIRASQAALHRRRVRTIIVLSTVVTLAVAALVVAVAARVQRSDAISQSYAAQSEAMAAEAANLYSTNAPLAMLLSLQAYDRSPTLQARSALIQAAGQPLDDLMADGSTIHSMAFSPDGRTLAVGDESGSLGLWDTRTGRRTAVLGGVGTGYTVAFSRDGATLAVGSKNGTVSLWDTRTDTRTTTLNEGSAVGSVAFSPDDRTLAIGTGSGTVELWDTRAHRPTAALKEGSNVVDVAFSPDGHTLAVSDSNTNIGLWDTGSHRRTALLAEGSIIGGIAFSPDGHTLAVGDFGGNVTLWNTGTRQRSATLAEGSPVAAVAFSPDGHTIAAADYGGLVGLWDATTHRRSATVANGSIINVMAFSPDGRTLAVGDDVGDIGLWDTGSGHRNTTFAVGSSVLSVTFSPDGRTLAVGSSSGIIGVWDTGTDQQIQSLIVGSSVYSVAFSPDGRTLAAGDFAGNVTLWDARTGKEIDSIPVGSSVYSVAYSRDGRTLALGENSGTVSLWDTTDDRRIATLAESHPVFGLSFSPDDRTLAAGYGDATVGLWDTRTHRRTATLPEGGVIGGLAFSPDGHTLAVGDGSSSISLWDTRTDQRTAILAEGNIVINVSFSSDGQMIAAGDTSGVSLWDAASGRRIATFAEPSPVESIAFSPKADTLALGDLDGDVVLLRQGLSAQVGASLPRQICDEVRRNMTATEWAANVAGQPYQQTCPEYP